MAMAEVMFNTLSYVNKLKKGGVAPQLAELQAEVQADLLRDVVNTHLVTKKDFDVAVIGLRQDINDLRIATKNDLNVAVIELRQDINELRITTKNDLDVAVTGLRQDINELRITTQHDIKNLKSDLIALQDKLIIKMGGFMALGITILATLMTVLHIY
jgi:hypothetical protein